MAIYRTRALCSGEESAWLARTMAKGDHARSFGSRTGAGRRADGRPPTVASTARSQRSPTHSRPQHTAISLLDRITTALPGTSCVERRRWPHRRKGVGLNPSRRAAATRPTCRLADPAAQGQPVLDATLRARALYSLTVTARVRPVPVLPLARGEGVPTARVSRARPSLPQPFFRPRSQTPRHQRPKAKCESVPSPLLKRLLPSAGCLWPFLRSLSDTSPRANAQVARASHPSLHVSLSVLCYPSIPR